MDPVDISLATCLNSESLPSPQRQRCVQQGVPLSPERASPSESLSRVQGPCPITPARDHVSCSQPTRFLRPLPKMSTFCLQNIIYIKTKRRKITGKPAFLALSDKCKIGFYKLEGSCLQGVRGNLHKDDLFSYQGIEAVHLKWIQTISCVWKTHTTQREPPRQLFRYLFSFLQ